MEPSPGTYILLMRLESPVSVAVGRLGVFSLEAGLYAYVGSAHGPGGLRARLSRHLRRDKPLHWHIDALTALAPVIQITYTVSAERLECAWAGVLAALPGAGIPVRGFGSSDCRCAAHLFTLPEESLPALWSALDRPGCPLITVSV